MKLNENEYFVYFPETTEDSGTSVNPLLVDPLSEQSELHVMKEKPEAGALESGTALPFQQQTMQCAGHLPGIGNYQSSSDDETGSSSDVEDQSMSNIVQIIMKRSGNCAHVEQH